MSFDVNSSYGQSKPTEIQFSIRYLLSSLLRMEIIEKKHKANFIICFMNVAKCQLKIKALTVFWQGACRVINTFLSIMKACAV